MGQIYIPKLKNVTVRLEGKSVQLIEEGMLILEMPYQAALDIARAIRSQAMKASQMANVQRVISDQALLIRKGVPLRLTSRPDVFKEAGNEAAHNRDLRRFLPGGIPSGVAFGCPAVRHKPAKHTIGPKGIPSGEEFGKIGGKK